MKTDTAKQGKNVLNKKPALSDLNIPKSVLMREQVYSYLKKLLNDGKIKPGTALDLKSLSENMGFSRTPLRDALLRLEAEGFVTINSRRGVLVSPLDLHTIKNAYQIIGALECAAILEAGGKMEAGTSHKMLELNERMKLSLNNSDFNAYYLDNLAFHDCYISLSKNEELKRTVKVLKERLYDFPRLDSYISQWELASVKEHDQLIKLFLEGNFEAAAILARDVHWSYEAQEHFIKDYYFKLEAAQ